MLAKQNENEVFAVGKQGKTNTNVYVRKYKETMNSVWAQARSQLILF